MELSELQTLVTDFKELQRKIVAEKSASQVPTYLKQFDISGHDITDTSKRQDKIVELDNGDKQKIEVARLPIPFQKKIVNLAAAFLCGNPVQLVAMADEQTEEDFLEVIKRTWDDNKLDYESKRLAKIMMSETEVAELWYTEKADPGYWAGTVNDTASVKFRLRMKILANTYGDTLHPVFNNAGDMIAFGRAYQLKVDGKVVDHFDVYTDQKFYKAVRGDSDWTVEEETNMIGKIPVIYYSQSAPEWNDVQHLIDRLEKLISNHADSNDYFGAPMVFVQGDVKGFAKKGEQGKVLIGENGAKAEYLTWDQAPESVKLEYNNLRSLIFDMTDTPDISIEQMKSLGTYSGIALKMLFLGAHLKASDKEETFGKGIQRRINYIKAALVKINVTLEQVATMTIKPKFEYYLPKNIQEMIEILATATGSKAIMSQESAIEQNPLVVDPEQEKTRIQSDEAGSTQI